MCGIAGVVSPPGAPPPDAADVLRACEAIRHRGPDHGTAKRFGQCALGYRRLRVVDLVSGDQPVANESGDVVAVLNGELYGFPALRAELARAGHRVPGTGDTPVLPHLYEEHGVGFVERLDGMFALALWDGPGRRLVLARDRLGKKPLLWTRRADGSIAFASELKALLALGGVERRVDLRALDAYLALGYVPGDATALAGVRRLPPGHLLVVEDGEARVERYWRPAPRPLETDDAGRLEAVRAAVLDAVRKRLVADVPLGALLSGGLDSSVVVAAMAQVSGEPVRTFSVGFREERYDERPYARLVAERFGTLHEEIVVEPDAASLLPHLAEAWDEPFADSSALPTYLLCEHARRFVTVALGGDGGDEAFAGYERYRAFALAERLSALPPALPRAAAAALRRLPGGQAEPRSAPFRAARFLETSGLGPAARYGRLVEVFPAELRADLLTEDALAEVGRPSDSGELLGAPPRRGDLTGLQLLDLETYLPGDLLVKADIASMAHSLELRSPLLDRDVVELALGLPDRLKAHRGTGKVALRRAFASDLPPEVLRRGKRGFGVPVSRWFRGELRELAGDLLLDATACRRGLLRPEGVERLLADHLSGRADHGARLWSLVMLELWHRRYVDATRLPAPADRLARSG